MLKFGIIAEGVNDQTVIENILLGYFVDEPVIVPIQPADPLIPGGWGNVFASLKRGDCEKALQFNDFVIVHIDADKQDEPGYDVPRQERGVVLSLKERVDRIVKRLKSEIEVTFLAANSHRILFAIAVDTIECWLLPLLTEDKKKAAKTTGCEKAANHELETQNRNKLSAGGKTFRDSYEDASKEFRKRKRLLQVRNRNESLELFICQLDKVQEQTSEDAAEDSNTQAVAPSVDPPGDSEADTTSETP